MGDSVEPAREGDLDFDVAWYNRVAIRRGGFVIIPLSVFVILII
jgi:hypothetical protein